MAEKHITLVTANGEEHGLVNTLPNAVKDNGFEHMDPKTKTEAEKLRKEEARMVKARYINHRGSHERLDKSYMRWAGDPIRVYHLIPGQTYDLPYGLVKEINDNPGLKKRGEQIVDGKFVQNDMSPLKIHELVPVSF